MKHISLLFIFAAALLASCGSHKNVTDVTKPSVETTKTDDASLKYVRKVYDNRLTAQNVVSKMDVALDVSGNSVSLGGKLQMRRDKVIRLTLTYLGLMEVGKIEFTPENVIVINRINKEYAKAKYTDLDFLKDNGIDFYTLQALFWNELFLPGTQVLRDADLSKFKVAQNTTAPNVSYTTGRFNFSWATNAKNALITNAVIDYAKATSNTSTATMAYSSFTPVGGKQFPAHLSLSFVTQAKAGQKFALDIKLSKPTDDSSWDAETSISSKYTEVNATEMLKKLK